MSDNEYNVFLNVSSNVQPSEDVNNVTAPLEWLNSACSCNTTMIYSYAKGNYCIICDLIRENSW